jgi:hypothetical protein
MICLAFAFHASFSFHHFSPDANAMLAIAVVARDAVVLDGNWRTISLRTKSKAKAESDLVY